MENQTTHSYNDSQGLSERKGDTQKNDTNLEFSILEREALAASQTVSYETNVSHIVNGSGSTEDMNSWERESDIPDSERDPRQIRQHNPLLPMRLRGNAIVVDHKYHEDPSKATDQSESAESKEANEEESQTTGPSQNETGAALGSSVGRSFQAHVHDKPAVQPKPLPADEYRHMHALKLPYKIHKKIIILTTTRRPKKLHSTSSLRGMNSTRPAHQLHPYRSRAHGHAPSQAKSGSHGGGHGKKAGRTH